MERWEQRITLRNLRLTDRFLNFGLNILLHVRFDPGEIGVICLEHIASREPIGGKDKVVCNGKEGAVFVDVIQLMDSPKRITSALVWFEPVDSFFRPRSHSLYFSSLIGFILAHRLCNREFNLSAGNGTWRANHDKLVWKMIKCGPEIVDNISSHRNRVKGKGWDFPNIW